MASLDLIYLVDDSNGTEYCNSDELLTKVAESIINELKNKYQKRLETHIQ